MTEVEVLRITPESLNNHRAKQDEECGEDQREERHHFTPTNKNISYEGHFFFLKNTIYVLQRSICLLTNYCEEGHQ